MLRYIALCTVCGFGCVASAAFAGVPLANIEGDLPGAIQAELSDALGEVKTPARSLAQARRRAKKAAERATSVMRSNGYYGAEVIARVTAPHTDANTTAQARPQPLLTISAGPQFTIGTLNIEYMDAAPEDEQEVFSTVLVHDGAPALAADIVDSEVAAIAYLNIHGYPDARPETRKVIVDHETGTASVTYKITAGQKTAFGEIEQTGTAKLAKSWPQMIAPFKPGDSYDIRQLKKLTSRVTSTAVFSSATATMAEKAVPNGDGSVTRNVLLNIDQGKANSVTGEIGISTTDGSGIDLIYERRNFKKYAQTLTMSATVKTNKIYLGTEYNVPYAWRVDRELDISTEIGYENTDAYEGFLIGSTGFMTQKIAKNLKAGLGIGLEASRFDEVEPIKIDYLVGVLARGTYDSRDSIFDPKKGYFAEAAVTPIYNVSEADGGFVTATLGANAYRTVSPNLRAAGRAKIGTIFGGNIDTIPINRRFFGGGGGSVRGFGYQTISPVDENGEPVGGRSITELVGELRYKGDSAIGYAAFVDAGSVANKESPNFGDLRVGAGVGVRYYTAFAPLRADIAIPLNKRASDDKFQIYISIGQAF